MSNEMNIRKSTKTMILMSMFIAITAILANTPIGMIRILPTVDFTISHIPTIVAGIVAGPIAGAIVGGTFGIISMLRAISNPIALQIFFVNPLVSVLPRIFIGISTFYVYKLFNKFSKKISVILAAAVGSLTNTIGCLGMLYMLYYKQIQTFIEESGQSVKMLFGTIILTNGLTEMLVSVVVSYFIVISLKRIVGL